MKTLERRVSRIELHAIPAAPIMVFTDSDEAELFAAQAKGNRVIVAHADWPSSRREVVGGIEHLSTVVAGLTQLAGSPSKHGRINALADFFVDLQGKARVFGPVPMTRMLIDDADDDVAT